MYTMYCSVQSGKHSYQYIDLGVFVLVMIMGVDIHGRTGGTLPPFFEVEGTPYVVPPFFLKVETKIVATRCQILRRKFTKLDLAGDPPQTQLSPDP